MVSSKALKKGGFFKKLGNGKYKGKSGKIFDLKQVQMWYSLGGKFPKENTKVKTKKK